jgi:proteasome-associated ATPase
VNDNHRPAVFIAPPITGPLTDPQQKELATLRKFFEDLDSKHAFQVGWVVEVVNPQLLLWTSGGPLHEAHVPPQHLDVEPGDTVRIINGQVFGRAKAPVKLGPVATVARVVSDTLLEVDWQMQRRTVRRGRDAARVGDRVVLDPNALVAIANLGPDTPAAAPAEDAPVDWDDIGGLEGPKRELREAIEDPVTHAALYAAFGQAPPKGILLEGPPGTGKTLLGRAAATALARLHGKTASGGGFVYVPATSILDAPVGSSERTVRRHFEAARAYAAAHGHRAILFFDEADAVLMARGGGARSALTIAGHLEGMERTIVPAFLTEMDGMHDPALAPIVMMATNRAERLDPAVVRDERIALKLTLPRPGQAACAEIALVHLRDKPAHGSDAELAGALVARLFAPSLVVGMVRVTSGGDERLTLGDLASGAMISGIVKRAALRAIRRAKAGDGPPALTLADVTAAVDDKHLEARVTDQSADAILKVGHARFKSYEPERGR